MIGQRGGIVPQGGSRGKAIRIVMRDAVTYNHIVGIPAATRTYSTKLGSEHNETWGRTTHTELSSDQNTTTTKAT